MARVVIVLGLLLLAGCAAGEPAPNTVQASYDAEAHAIRLRISDFQPATRAELIASDGTRYAATGVNVLRGPFTAYNPPPTIGIGIGGFGFSGCCSGFGSSLGLGFPVGGPTPGASSDQFISAALIPVPADYAERWRDDKIEVRLGTRSVTLPAPQPGG